jgi:hypothetical protein
VLPDRRRVSGHLHQGFVVLASQALPRDAQVR